MEIEVQSKYKIWNTNIKGERLIDWSWPVDYKYELKLKYNHNTIGYLWYWIEAQCRPYFANEQMKKSTYLQKEIAKNKWLNLFARN